MCQTWINVDSLTAYSLESQLKREVGAGHVLCDVPVRVVARCDACDDVLAESIATGQRYGVHLTWGDQQNAPYPETWLVGEPWHVQDIDDGVIRVDVESTITAFHKRGLHPWDACDCAHCRNMKAQKDSFLPDDVHRWLSSCGINPSHPTESDYTAPVGDGHLYSVMYHMRGVIDPVHANSDEYRSVTFQLGDTVISISDLIGGFPEPLESCDSVLTLNPILQVYFDVVVPWVVDLPEPT